MDKPDIVERLNYTIEHGMFDANVDGMLAEYPDLLAEITRLRAQLAAAREGLEVANEAIRDMFRYYDGGETRGSYDGRPERRQLREAGERVRITLAALKETDNG